MAEMSVLAYFSCNKDIVFVDHVSILCDSSLAKKPSKPAAARRERQGERDTLH